MNAGFDVDRWVTKLRPNPKATCRLFCFPYAGGNTQIFRRWPDYLPASVELCPIELPGRATRLKEPLFTQLPPLVEALVRVLEPYLDKPFAFFGHSMGALISFETARYCRKYHLATPMHLFISGHGAPHLSRDEPPLYDLPEAEFLNELYQLNGTPPEVLAHEELMQLMLPILRADFAVCETYAYEPEAPLGCPITVFGGLEDPGVQVDELKAWREQTSSVCSVRMFPGDHFFLQAMPSLFLQTLARELHMLRV